MCSGRCPAAPRWPMTTGPDPEADAADAAPGAGRRPGRGRGSGRGSGRVRAGRSSSVVMVTSERRTRDRAAGPG